MITLLFRALDDEMLVIKGLIMFSIEIVLLGLALSIDAAIVCFAFGILGLDKPKALRITHWLGCALSFGAFQALMLWTGSYAGFKFSFSSYGHLFHLLVVGIFFLMAMKVFKDSLEQNEDEDNELQWGAVPLLVLGFATSIDALAAGISLGTLPNSHEAAILVGFITFLMCSLFYSFSLFFKNIPDKWLLRLTGLIFVLLGGRIVLDFVQRGIL